MARPTRLARCHAKAKPPKNPPTRPTHWFFARTDKRLRYQDARPIKLGTTHSVTGTVRLCSNGLHASKKLSDALAHAPGPVVYRVALSGDRVNDTSLIPPRKTAARHRTYLSGGVDITPFLMDYLRTLLWDAYRQNPKLWPRMPKQVLRYLETANPGTVRRWSKIVHSLSGDRMRSIRSGAHTTGWYFPAAIHSLTESGRYAQPLVRRTRTVLSRLHVALPKGSPSEAERDAHMTKALVTWLAAQAPARKRRAR